MENEIRMIRKRFKCCQCEAKKSKLVGANDTLAVCENCSGIMREISEEEYSQKSRDQINQNYRIVFDENNRREYHNRFDANDTKRYNINGETNKKFRSEEAYNNNSNQNRQQSNDFFQSGHNQYSTNSNNSRNFQDNRNSNYNQRPNNQYSSRNHESSGRGTHRSSNRGFNNYNIYNSDAQDAYGNNFNFHQRSNSPQNNNFYNYYQNNSNRRRENREHTSGDNFSSGIGNIFNNLFGLGGNSNNRSQNNNTNNFYPNSNSNSRRFNSQSNTGDFFGDFFSGLNVNFNFGNPFGDSPFMGRINRHHFNDDIFDPGFQTFGTTFNNFFQDNFASNFRSNFSSSDNFFDIFNLIRTRNENQPAHPATSKEAIKSLKKFKMNDKYCKKNEKGELEVPSCSICISDIAKGEETLLLPCGHMYHSDCALPWLKKNNTCPVCRFELPPEN